MVGSPDVVVVQDLKLNLATAGGIQAEVNVKETS
jgi:hypothetical protein